MLKSKSGRDYFFTFLVEIINMLAGLFVYRLAADNLSQVDFSEYAVGRRVLSSLQPFLVMGMGVAVPRFVAMAVSANNRSKAGDYFYGGLLLMAAAFAVFLVLIALMPGEFAYVFFGDEKFDSLAMPVATLVGGALVHSLAYGYLRGSLHMQWANVIQLLNIGLVPLSVYLFCHTATSVIFFTGLFWAALGGLVLVIIALRTQWHFEKIKPALREMFRYGIQRVPGDFVLGIFFSLPVFMVNHTQGIVTGGYISVALTILNLAGAAFSPISLMLLTDASQLLVQKNYTALQRRVSVITKVTILLTFLGILLVESLTPFILQVFVDTKHEIAVFSTRIAMISAIGYTLYISLRSLPDAYYSAPINTINILIAFTVFVVPALIGQAMDQGYIFILSCFSAGMILLGFLTLSETRKIINTSDFP